MKLSYYGYTVYNFSDDTHILYSLQDFIKSFCNLNNPEFKNSFTHNGENIYLLNVTDNLYLFIQTKNKEVIKKINTAEISAHEITDEFASDESIGFASYVYIQAHYFGFASTVLAPRVKAFVDFISTMIRRLIPNKYQMASFPLISHTTRQEILNKPIIGKTMMLIERESNLFERITEVFGADYQQFENVGALYLVVKPSERKNIDSAVKQIIQTTDDDDVSSFIIRAKNETNEALQDFYIEGRGLISDTINKRKRDEFKIRDQIIEKIDGNNILLTKVREHETNPEFQKCPIVDLLVFNSTSGWGSAVGDVQTEMDTNV